MAKAKKIVVDMSKEELEGKLVLVKKQFLKPQFHDRKCQYFLCQRGFGCSPNSSGGKIFGFYLNDAGGEYIRREYVEEVVPITEGFQKRIDEVTALLNYRETHCCACKEEVISGTRSYNMFTKKMTCHKCKEANTAAESASL